MSSPLGLQFSSQSGESYDAGSAALSLVEQAIAILDAAEYPADIAAHLDLACHRLRDAISASRLDAQGSPQ
jgi:hypothetical protein